MIAEAAPYVAGALATGGVAVGVSRRRELVARWLTWTIAAAAVLGALQFGTAGAALLGAGLGVAAAAEYGRLLRLGTAERVAMAAAAGALPVLAWLAPEDWPRVAAALLLAVVLVPVLAGDAADGGRRAAYSAFGVLWLAPLAGLVVLGPEAALALLVAVAVGDVSAWCAGKAFGRTRLGGRPLSPLSPAKTWAGAVGGAAGGVAVLAALGFFAPVLTLPLVVAVAVGAPLGDLLESMLKRGAGAKDAGSWVPGFGGLLDRIDSLLVALAVAVVLT